MNFPTTQLATYTAGTTILAAAFTSEFGHIYTAINALATRPMAQVRTNTALAVSTSAADTILPWNAENFDTNTFHSNTVNPEYLQTITSGYYEARAHLVFPAATTGTFRQFAIIATSGAIDTTIYTMRATATTNIQTLDGTIVYAMSANNYFSVGAQHNHTSALSLSTESYFYVRQVG